METQEVGGHDRNSSNPMAGCRMKQICSAVRGESRRSREERHGRKVLCAWQHRAEGKPSRGTTGTGREQCMSAEGHSLENHKRGSSTELLDTLFGSISVQVKAGRRRTGGVNSRRPNAKAGSNKPRRMGSTILTGGVRHLWRAPLTIDLLGLARLG